MDRLESRCVGALIGTFVGDALGMPVEGWAAARIREIHGRLEEMVEARRGAGTYTDDTQLMIATARSLLWDDTGAAEPERVVDCLGANSTTGGSVLTADHAFCSHLGSLEEAVVYAGNLGGDTDTIGAMTGALAGALQGVEAIPDRRWEALENGEDGRDEVVGLGEDLDALRRARTESS